MVLVPRWRRMNASRCFTLGTRTETVLGATHTMVYGYDASRRLKDVTRDGTLVAHYEYGANRNRTVGPGLTLSPVYDTQDRMTSYGGCSYAYSADGSLQTKTCGTATTTYVYE